jgi:hypothetical protein
VVGGFVVVIFLHGVVSCPRGASPRCGRVCLALNSFGVGFVGLLSQKQKSNNLEDTKQGLRVHNPSIFTLM